MAQPRPPLARALPPPPPRRRHLHFLRQGPRRAELLISAPSCSMRFGAWEKEESRGRRGFLGKQASKILRVRARVYTLRTHSEYSLSLSHTHLYIYMDKDTRRHSPCVCVCLCVRSRAKSFPRMQGLSFFLSLCLSLARARALSLSRARSLSPPLLVHEGLENAESGESGRGGEEGVLVHVVDREDGGKPEGKHLGILGGLWPVVAVCHVSRCVCQYPIM
jgi:hypothetical protein